MIGYGQAPQDFTRLWRDHELRHIRSGLVDVELDRTLKGDLARALPSLRMDDYFRIKPDTFRGADHVVASFDSAGRADGTIVSAWRRLSDGTPFVHLVTAFVGETQQGSELLWQMWAVHWEAVAASWGGCPGLIAFRTYNPRSFRALGGFARIEGAEFYPSIPLTPAGQPLGELAEAVAAVISEGFHLDVATGVVRGGAVGVPVDFYPSLQLTRSDVVNEYFREEVRPVDRVLCMLRLGTETARARFMEASSTGRGPRAV